MPSEYGGAGDLESFCAASEKAALAPARSAALYAFHPRS